jgi:1-acyl-sn-glycerol-3-phosphate acyltransferase
VERWPTRRTGASAWERTAPVADQAWTRGEGAGRVREALQQGLLFPAARFVARPVVHGADDLEHAPQPAVIAANHSSDLDTPLLLDALPRSWRTRTLVGAAADRFYRKRRYAVSTALWIGTFPFDRTGDGRGLARAATLLGDGWNLLLYPQATRSSGALGGFRSGVARLCVTAGVPAVPVHVGGTALMMPKGRGLTQRGQATITFGRPLMPHPDEEPAAFGVRLSGAIAALAGG